MCLRVCCYVLFSKYMYADFQNQQRNTLLHMHTRRQVIFTAKETENAFLNFFYWSIITFQVWLTFTLKSIHTASILFWTFNTLLWTLSVSFLMFLLQSLPLASHIALPTTIPILSFPFTLQLNIHWRGHIYNHIHILHTHHIHTKTVEPPFKGPLI